MPSKYGLYAFKVGQYELLPAIFGDHLPKNIYLKKIFLLNFVGKIPNIQHIFCSFSAKHSFWPKMKNYCKKLHIWAGITHMLSRDDIGCKAYYVTKILLNVSTIHMRYPNPWKWVSCSQFNIQFLPCIILDTNKLTSKNSYFLIVIFLLFYMKIIAYCQYLPHQYYQHCQ